MFGDPNVDSSGRIVTNDIILTPNQILDLQLGQTNVKRSQSKKKAQQELIHQVVL